MKRRRLALGLAASIVARPVLAANDIARLVDELRKGGFVIYFRHGDTGDVTFDAPRAVMGDCSTQRNLNAAGLAQVRKLGEDFRALHIPVGKVLSSEYCRCWQHAEAMFGKGNYTIDARLTLPASHPSVTEADRRKNNDNLRALLSEPPAAGRNTVLVSHGFNVMALTGFHPNTQGEALIFRPDGRGGFERRGSVLPTEWPKAR